MISYTYNRKAGIMETLCPFGQRVAGIFTRTYGEGEPVRVGSIACANCPEYIEDTLNGVICRKEK